MVILGLSGNHSAHDEAMEAKMDDFLIKPMPPHLVVQKVSQVREGVTVTSKYLETSMSDEDEVTSDDK